jgi:DNA topoisomerase-1
MTDHIIRKKKGDNFEYYTINNKKITNKKILDKIKKIYIAPAYSNVEIYLNGNILATGINKAGRKQYIYSESMKKKRELKKYKKLIKLTLHIDKLKKKINNDLTLKEFNKNKLIALVLKIMDLCNFRSGNKTYEKKYGSFGITTIHKKHVFSDNSETRG